MKDKMTWEETIRYIRTQPEFQFLVEKAYFEEDLPINVVRYRQEAEYKETLNKIRKYAPNAKKILDIGSGNGITCVSFALEGYEVTTVEPDPSDTVGAGAIRKLKLHYGLENLTVHEAFAEEIKFNDEEFDIVFARQCMHHAYDLQKFVGEMSRVVKKGGMFFTVRDHVIFNENDKQWFLENHPLQKYYGGENAFTPEEYKNAIKKSNLEIIEELNFFDSEINFFPQTQEEIDRKKQLIVKSIKGYRFLKFFPEIIRERVKKKLSEFETQIPGRMYSYIAIKK
ncbi:class I SAM-dependent methyltransferase [Chryseobacterium sp. C-71]|uniref:class I SAM-dependent methyltransferase n=1 Tax=Chryseobacterium sp. C-71 TaxID=2893882 RepID=UPI001E381AD0|nr:class I SAM-dependent methyltransferase [Chryseobacterium sp. C-71]UFH30875.1 class I SAM-dependent methyltransferase [Chryseobacterium sp. C-71]